MRYILVLAALSGMMVVILGAYGQHSIGLTDLTQYETILFVKAQKYHMWHTLAILLIGAFVMSSNHSKNNWLANLTALLFLAGILLFAGNIYLKAFATGYNLDFLVPIGGMLFIVGWVLMAVLLWRFSTTSR